MACSWPSSSVWHSNLPSVSIQIAPSILNADFANLEREIGRISKAAQWVHVDVMDGHFVPNLTIGLPVVESLARVSPLPLDAHLMIEDPTRWAPAYIEAGATSATFHIEATDDARATIAAIRGVGGRVGCAFKPGTALDPDIIPLVDMVLIMTVEPGFGGQSFMDAMMAKVSAARSLIGRLDREIWVQVDGGISDQTIEVAAKAGANVFVAGSAVYRAEDPHAMVISLRDQAASAYCADQS
jgi:ribulose-phosphate 3-epimerase